MGHRKLSRLVPCTPVCANSVPDSAYHQSSRIALDASSVPDSAYHQSSRIALDASSVPDSAYCGPRREAEAMRIGVSCQYPVLLWRSTGPCLLYTSPSPRDRG
eukprot:2066616-Rhodomonas_salina.1